MSEMSYLEKIRLLRSGNNGSTKFQNNQAYLNLEMLLIWQ